MRSRIETPAVRSAAGVLDGETDGDMGMSIYDRTSPILYSAEGPVSKERKSIYTRGSERRPRYLHNLNAARQIRGGRVFVLSKETRTLYRSVAGSSGSGP